MSNNNVIIIGAGPAGLSAALWLYNLGCHPIVVERESVTGGMQNSNFLENDWVLGQSDITGPELAKKFYQHVENKLLALHVHTTVCAITKSDHQFSVTLSNQETIFAKAIVLANGTRYAGADMFSGASQDNIVVGPYTFLGLEDMNAQHIAIIGAGDNAFENADMLLKQGCSVSLIARSTPKAQHKLQQSVGASGRFTLYEQTQVHDVIQHPEKLQIIFNNKHSDLWVDRLHILVGYRSNIDSITPVLKAGLGEVLTCDENDFALVDAYGRTNIENIYAAGDVCNAVFPCVVSAVASGALVAKSINASLS